MRYRAREFDQLIHINALGLRGSDLDERKPPGTVRILVLGDSFVEGAQVALEDTFVARIERALASRFAERRWQVINGGVSRYGTADEIELFELRGRSLSPDIVLLTFFTGNDVADNRDSRFFRWQDGRLVETPPARPSRALLWAARIKEIATSRSHFVQLIRDRMNDLALRWSLRSRFRPESEAGSPPEPISDVDWALTDALLGELQRRVLASGARLWLVIIPSRERALDTKPARPEASLHEKLLHWAQLHSLPCVDLLPALRAAARQGSPYYRIDAHFNARGHEVAAEAIVDSLMRGGSPVSAAAPASD